MFAKLKSENAHTSKNVFFDFVKGLVVAIIISLALVVLFAFILKWATVPDSVIPFITLAIKGLSVLVGSLISVKGESKGLVKGAGFGMLYVVIAFLLFSKYGRNLSVRVLTVVTWSIAVIFIGYSSYALILIRSSADTPMNQNSPDNVFDLASYLNREQYGENPLLYGETLFSAPMKEVSGIMRDTIGYYEDGTPAIISTPYYNSVITPGKAQYAKGVEGATPVSEYGFLSEDGLPRGVDAPRRRYAPQR